MSDRWSLERKVARLFWITVHGASADAPHPANVRAFGVHTPAEVIRQFRPGGVTLFAWSGNTEHPTQVAQLTADLRAASSDADDAPLAVAIDEEGGRVTRLGAPATAFPSARAVAVATAEDPELAQRRWLAAARELAAVGVTTNLAPVADLGNAWNPVVGDRAFADDAATVGHHAALAVRGLHEGGIAAVAKHFPGHGATRVDSHASLPVVTLSREELEPHIDAFRQLLAREKPAGIMPGHLLVDALDPDRPATTSPAILTGLLRTELAYDGSIVTDSLAMEGIRGRTPDHQVAVAALAAGADVLLMPPDLPRAITAICDAVRAGEITEERIEQSLDRARGLVQPAQQETAHRIGAAEHHEVAAQISRHALLIDEADGAPLPLPDRPVVVVGVTGSGARGLTDALARHGRPAALVEVPCHDLGAARLAAAGQEGAEAATRHDAALDAAEVSAALRHMPSAVLVLVRRAPEVDAATQDDLLGGLTARGEAAVLVETGATAAGWWTPSAMTRVRTHDASVPALEAAAGALAGSIG